MKKVGRTLLPLAVLAAAALFLPSAAQAFTPKVVTAYANYEAGQVTFTVKVRFDKTRARNRSVQITYNGDTSDGNKLKNFPSYYESDPYSAAKKDCYTITVRATNNSGTTTTNVKAGRISTNGCPNNP